MNYFITLRTVDTVLFNEAQRAIVHNAVGEVAEHWGYEVRAVNVMSNSAQLLISQGKTVPEKILTGAKAWSTRHLRKNGTLGADEPVWQQGGDIVPVEDPDAFERIRLFIEQNHEENEAAT